VLPELLVEPEGLETGTSEHSRIAAASGQAEDTLVALFRKRDPLPADSFLAELRRQRGVSSAASV
jgi:hypothetical protein